MLLYEFKDVGRDEIMAQFTIKIVKSSSSMDAGYYPDVVVNSTLYCFDFEY